MKRTTIKDIARLTGLSISTISRALKGHPDISTATREKVSEVADAMGYKPNLGARSLRTQSSKLIGVILPRADTFFFPEVLEGISEVVGRHGYSFIFLQSENSLKREDELLELCMQMSVEGVLISLSVETKEVNHLQKLKKRNVPVVLMDRVIETQSFPCVSINDVEVSRSAVDFLIKKGHQKILGVFDDDRLEMTNLREAGFREALKNKKIELEEKQVVRIREGEDVNLAIAKLLDCNEEATAIFSMSDKLMVQTYHILSNYGLAIPEDVALISISDGKAPFYFYPNISHMRHSGKEVGSTAASILFDHIQGQSMESLFHYIKAPLKDLGSV
ncbi:MAG: LacI family DNA-binding transcriptional regulator [Saprospiraceae bacterium]